MIKHRMSILLMGAAMLLAVPVAGRPRAPELNTPSVIFINGCASVNPTRLTDDTASIAAGVMAAQNSSGHCVILGPGQYRLAAPSAAGTLFPIYADGLQVRGPGAVLQWADNIVYPSDWVAIFTLSGRNEGVHDLIIKGGLNPSGGNWRAVGCTLGCERASISGLDISGIYGSDSAGGEGITVYTPWDQGGYSGALIENNYIHDSAHATAISLDSWGSTVRNNKIVRVGSRATEHGIYLQGGRNVVENNWIEAVGGYSLHKHGQTPHADAASDVIQDNISINPGAGHLVDDTIPNDVNPAFPPGTPLNQGDLITGNSFLGTLTETNSIGVWANGVPVRILGNFFRDATRGYTWLDTHTAPGSTISDNQFVGAWPTGTAYIVYPGADTTLTGNVWQHIQTGYGALLTDGDVFSANVMQVDTGTWPIQLVGGANITGNTIRSADNPTVQILSGAQGWAITGNTLSSTDRWALRINGDNAGTTGTISGNLVTGGVIQLAEAGITVSDNTGILAYDAGLAALSITGRAGTLSAMPFGSDLAAGGVVAWVGSGIAPAPAHSDSWVGITLGTTYGGSGVAYIAAQRGAVVSGVCGANTLPVGHVGVVGDTIGCLVDGGGVAPGGSYVRSLGGGEVELHP